MCEINPKHTRIFRLEAFTSHPDMTRDEFDAEVLKKVLDVEQVLNLDGRFRFHVHEMESDEEMLVILSQRLGHGILDPDIDDRGEAFFNDKG